jgi:hypothetical protein
MEEGGRIMRIAVAVDSLETRPREEHLSGEISFL